MKNYDHQQKVIDKDPIKRGIFMGTGSGKTLIACRLARGKTLVICPKTVRDKRHWQQEWIDKLGLDFAQLTVMSKEDFKKTWRDAPSIFNQFKGGTIIGDEAHTLAGVQPATFQKNYKKYPKTSQIFESLLEMISKINPDRVYMLTATPTSQPMTVWGLGQLLGQNWDYFKFRNTFYFEKSRNIWLKKKGEKYKNILAEAVNSIGEVGRLQDWFDVPEQTYRNHYIEPTKEQSSYLPELQMIYPDPLVQLGKRHQLEQGLFEGQRIEENKTKAIKQYLEEFRKVVVYARYTEQIRRYEHYFSKDNNVLVLDGTTKDRKDVLEEAEKMKSGVLIVQVQISEGYQLPSFECMIFASEFSFVHRKQAEGRILRADHLKKNLYITLICGQADTRMRKAVHTGEEFDEEVHAVNISKINKI